MNAPTIPQLGPLESKANYGADTFTGAFYYSYPIAVPKGTNDLAPEVALSYNSQGVRGVPSVVGAGWSLTESSVLRDVNWSAANASDDKFFLVLNGRRYELLYDGGSWHTKIESFFRIENLSGAPNSYGQYFRVRTPDGTTYRFGYNATSELNSSLYNYVTRWYLDQVEDLYGNRISYQYAENPNSGDIGAIYLTKIAYNNEQSRWIEFTYANRTDRRLSNRNGHQEFYTQRLSTIQVKVNTTGTHALVRRYDLAYHNFDALSTLASITVVGNDSTSTLPPTEFTYYNNTGWNTSENDPWNLNNTYAFQDTNGLDAGVRLADLNSDGLVDVIKRTTCDTAACTSVLLNNGSGWTAGNTGFIPNRNYSFIDNNRDNGVRFLDLNADGRLDLVKRQYSAEIDGYGALTNNGTGWQVNNSWTPAASSSFVFTPAIGYYGTEIADVNGDGYPDLVTGRTGSTNYVYLNTRSSWLVDLGWNMPNDYMFEDGARDAGTRLVDINGDGLPDLVKRKDCSTSTCSGVLLNNGSGWANTTLFAIPQDYAFIYTNYTDTGVRIVDVNGDGLPDLLKRQSCNATTCSGVLLNNGTGWKNTTGQWNISADLAFVNGTRNKAVRLTDVNGDGMVDLIKREECNATSCSMNWRSNAFRNHLLKEIKYPFGGYITIDYTSSTKPEYNNTGSDGIHDLPVAIDLVVSIRTHNGFSDDRQTIGQNDYTYRGGLYKFDGTSSEFRGFAESREQNPSGDNIVHRYHQTDALQGREYATEDYDGSTTLLKNTTRTFANTTVNGSYVVTLVSERVEEWDGQSPPRATSTTYTYDAYNNVLTKNDHGDVSVSGDERYERFTYDTNTTSWVLGAKRSTMLLASDNNTILRLTNYTNNAYGDPVAVRQYLSSGDAITNQTYDAYGNVIVIRDPRGYTTNRSYDNTKTYVVNETNPLGHSTRYDYELSTGNLRTRTDPNGYTTNYTYDNFGRPDKTIEPYDSSSAPTVQYVYDLDHAAPEIVEVRRKIDTTKNQTQRYLFDGFQQVIQTKTSAENTRWATQDYSYDRERRLNATSLPYFTTTSSYSAPNTSIPSTRYEYDGLDRITLINKTDNSFLRIVYDRDLTTQYDELNHRKDQYRDTRKNIIRIIEYNASQQYTTRYDYNTANELLVINDSSSNTIRFSYDTLGRKTGMIDPDMGTWNYTYDANNNLIRQRDNRGMIVDLTYDSLNRVTRKNSTNETADYTYDTIKGTLTRLQTTNANLSYTYDQRLRVTQENLTIDAFTFTTTYAYDSSNHITNKTLPDGTVVTTAYNPQGLVENITGVLNNADYNAAGSVTGKALANGLTTNLTYDTTTLRLARITTSNVQNVSYTYDAAGNIISIIDTVDGTTENITYDDLYRIQTARRTFTNGTLVFAYNYSIDALNRIRAIIGLAETLTFNYGTSPVHAPASVVTTGGTPTLSVTLLTPNASGNVTRYAFFNATARVCCTGADCGSINVSLDPLPEPTVEYDYDNKRECADGTCTITLYSSPRYGYEGTEWKPLEALHSFRGNTPIDCIVADDGIHHVECLDYNMTHRKLRISVNNEGRAAVVPVRVLKPALTMPETPPVAEDVLVADIPAATEELAIERILIDAPQEELVDETAAAPTIVDTPVDEVTVLPTPDVSATDVRTIAPVVPAPVKTYIEDASARQELTFTDETDEHVGWFAADLHDELHVGETSTNVTLVPSNATSFNGWWESKNGTLAMFTWSECDAHAYSAWEKTQISDTSTGTYLYGSDPQTGTDYSYCHRMQWQIPYNSSNITSITTWAYWTGSLNNGADSITKALYLGNTTSQTWRAVDVQPNAWGAVNHTATVNSGIADYVQTTGGNNYVYTLLHMNATKAGSSYAYSNFYDTVLVLTVDVANGSGGSNTSNTTAKGLVSNVTGTTPFYTTSPNPRLVNLSIGQCTDVTWPVNATGNTSTTYTFFAYANQTTNASNNARSSTINLTITNTTTNSTGNTPLPELLANYTFTSSNEGFNLGTDWTWDSTAGLLKYTGGAWGGNLYSPDLDLASLAAYNVTIVFTSGNITYTKFMYASSGTSITGDKYHFERSTDSTQHFKHDSAGYSSTDDYNNGAQQTIRISANFTVANTTRACRAGGSCTNNETVGSFARGDHLAISPGVMNSNTLNITTIEVWRTG